MSVFDVIPIIEETICPLCSIGCKGEGCIKLSSCFKEDANDVLIEALGENHYKVSFIHKEKIYVTSLLKNCSFSEALWKFDSNIKKLSSYAEIFGHDGVNKLISNYS